VNYIVLLAGTGIRGDKLLLLQQELVAKASGTKDAEIQQTREVNAGAFEILLKSSSAEAAKPDLKRYLSAAMKKYPDDTKPKGMTEDEFIALQLNQITAPWMYFFIRYDPSVALEKVKCPVLPPGSYPVSTTYFRSVKPAHQPNMPRLNRPFLL
jgi:hypothetical protein